MADIIYFVYLMIHVIFLFLFVVDVRASETLPRPCKRNLDCATYICLFPWVPKCHSYKYADAVLEHHYIRSTEEGAGSLVIWENTRREKIEVLRDSTISLVGCE
ncbi:hypothetical protein KIW84_076730 [Lathyrus oleraceus]|uniref:Late nodulin domain-containing protein n=1 Tax=Pisum sativum TaxID=3888 RepID=A0A9D4VYU9_PEA|nr:hypothetical protein KIW84_076730 [Pisum sativum]